MRLPTTYVEEFTSKKFMLIGVKFLIRRARTVSFIPPLVYKERTDIYNSSLMLLEEQIKWNKRNSAKNAKSFS